jgi:hypothetical protein
LIERRYLADNHGQTSATGEDTVDPARLERKEFAEIALAMPE